MAGGCPGAALVAGNFPARGGEGGKVLVLGTDFFSSTFCSGGDGGDGSR